MSPLPATPAAISGPAVVCSGAPATYSVPTSSNTSSYTWVFPAGWSASGTSNSIVATPGATSGTIYVIPNNACGTGNSQSLNVTSVSIPAQPAIITGATTPCVNTSQLYYIAAVNGATSYTWAYPAGGTPAWSGPTTGTGTTLTVGTNSGNVTVTANNQCGSSSPSSLAITVTNLPRAAGTITGPAAPCVGTTRSYSLAAVQNATSYNWTFPTTWSGVSTTNTISLTATSGSGTVTVTPVNVCGSGTAATLSVSTTPYVTPTVSLARNTLTDTVCSGTSVTFTATATNAGTSAIYTFRRNGSVVASGAANTYSTSTLNSGDRISVIMASSLPCVTLSQVSDSIRMIVLPVRSPGININTQPPTALCAGQTVTLQSNDTNGGFNPTYTWYLNGMQINGVTSKNYTPSTINNRDTFYVVMISKVACPKDTIAISNKVVFNVVPVVLPTVSVSSDPSGPVMSGTTVTFTATYSNGGNDPEFQWIRNGLEISGATGTSWTSSTLNSGDEISVRMLSVATCAVPELVMSNIIRMSVGTTGIAHTAGAFNGSVRLYPNPTSGHFIVEISGMKLVSGARSNIDIVNALGQTVYHMSFAPDRADWSHDVWLNDALANGTYLLRISSEQAGATAIPFMLNR
jgi:hypothetical protein